MIMGKLIARAGLGVASAVLGYWASLYLNQRALVFKPVNEMPMGIPQLQATHLNNALQAVSAPAKNFWFPHTQDACLLHGVSLEPPADTFDALVYFGGRSEDVRWVSDMARHCPGLAFYALNYRGFGLSEGEASEAAVVQDAQDLIRFLRADKRIRRLHIVGRSLGTGVAMQVAANNSDIDSLHLISPYDSMVNIAGLKFPMAPVGRLLKHRFESLLHAAHVGVPTHVVLAASDNVVPHENTQRLCAALRCKVTTTHVAASDHSSVVSHQTTWLKIAEIAA